MDTEIALNNMHCLVTKNHVGYDVVMNICNGVSKTVPWTSLDWIGASLAALMIFGLFAFIAGFIWVVVMDR